MKDNKRTSPLLITTSDDFKLWAIKQEIARIIKRGSSSSNGVVTLFSCPVCGVLRGTSKTSAELRNLGKMSCSNLLCEDCHRQLFRRRGLVLIPRPGQYQRCRQLLGR